MKKKLGLLLAVAMVMMIAITGCGKEEKKLDLSGCITLHYSGTDGKGKWGYEIDKDALYKEIISLAGEESDIYLDGQDTIVNGILNDMTINNCIYDDVMMDRFEVEQSLPNQGKLSNGDEVELTWEISGTSAYLISSYIDGDEQDVISGTIKGTVSGLE